MNSGLQVSFLLFHNAVVGRVRAAVPELDDDDVFDEARRLTTHRYQWLIVNEFLPQWLLAGAGVAVGAIGNVTCSSSGGKSVRQTG